MQQLNIEQGGKLFPTPLADDMELDHETRLTMWEQSKRDNTTMLVNRFQNATYMEHKGKEMWTDLVNCCTFSFEAAFYCLTDGQTLTLLENLARKLHPGQLVVILDKNEHNVAAIKRLRPIFQAQKQVLKIHENQGKNCMHSKFAIVDETVVGVSSSNPTFNSAGNQEAGLVSVNPVQVTEFSNYLNKLAEQAVVLV